MALITPISTTLISPLIGVSMPLQVLGNGVTYEQFLQSLGKYNYGAEFFYMSASTYQQIGQIINYNNKDASGNEVATSLPFTVDPYQSQPSIFYETDPEQIMFSGLTSLSFEILPNENVYFKFFATIAYVGNELDDRNSPNGDNAFEQLERAEGISFFDDYCNYIID
jgi:hypothetical protein